MVNLDDIGNMLKISDNLEKKDNVASIVKITSAGMGLEKFARKKQNAFNAIEFAKDNIDITENIGMVKNTNIIPLYIDLLTTDDLLSSSPEKLKASCIKYEHVASFLRITQAEINYILVNLNENSKPEFNINSLPTVGFVLDSLLKSKVINNANERLKKELSLVQQKVSYALQSAEMANVHLDDIGEVMHPLEFELHCIIDGSLPSPEKYTPRHPLGPLGFYSHHYKKFILADVLYQDYLNLIDSKLMQALKNYAKTNKQPLLIPPKGQRILKLKHQALKNKPTMRKAFKISNFR